MFFYVANELKRLLLRNIGMKCSKLWMILTASEHLLFRPVFMSTEFEGNSGTGRRERNWYFVPVSHD